MGKGINFLEGGPGKVVDLTQKKAQGPFLYSTGNYLIILHARNSFEQQMINKYQQEMKKEAESRDIFEQLFVCTFKSFDSIKYQAKLNDNFYILP